MQLKSSQFITTGGKLRWFQVAITNSGDNREVYISSCPSYWKRNTATIKYLDQIKLTRLQGVSIKYPQSKNKRSFYSAITEDFLENVIKEKLPSWQMYTVVNDLYVWGYRSVDWLLIFWVSAGVKIYMWKLVERARLRSRRVFSVQTSTPRCTLRLWKIPFFVQP